MPLLKLMYSGRPELSLVSIPLLVYHPTQILLGSLLTPHLRQWKATSESYGGYFAVDTQDTEDGFVHV